jgi:hypothetical protein
MKNTIEAVMDVEEDHFQDSESITVKSDLADVVTTSQYQQNLSVQASGTSSCDTESVVPNLSVDDLRNNTRASWRVTTAPCNDSYEGRQRRVKGWNTIVRTDTKKQLCTVKGSPYLLQNSDLFDFVDEIIQSGKYVLDRFNQIDGGREVSVQLRAKDLGKVDLITNDPAEAFLLARIRRKSRPAIDVTHKLIRLVCDNGLVGFGGETFKITNSIGAKDSLRALSQSIINAENKIPMIQQTYQQMASTSMEDPQDREDFWLRSLSKPWNDPNLIFASDEDAQEHFKAVQKSSRVLNKINMAYEAETELCHPDVHGTVWHAHQGFTHYIEHLRSQNSATKTKATSWGAGQKMVNRNYRLAEEFLLERVEGRVIA